MASPVPKVFVVSGLPGTGTSMMMRMLAQGGARILADDEPRGHYELEAVKDTARDASWLRRAPERVVKVESTVLRHLPPTASYRVVFMRRSLDHVARSQRLVPENDDDREARQAMAEHLVQLALWFDTARHVRALGVSYERLLANPEPEIVRIIRFLELELDAAAMLRAVER
jgi:hypothetical protein